MRRPLLAIVVGVTFGLAVGWLASTLPRPLGLILFDGLCLGILWWTLRQLQWARRMRRDLRDRDQH